MHNLSNQQRAIAGGNPNYGGASVSGPTEVGQQVERLGELARSLSGLRAELEARLGPVSASPDNATSPTRAPEPAIFSPLGNHLATIANDLDSECLRLRGLIDLLKI